MFTPFAAFFFNQLPQSYARKTGKNYQKSLAEVPNLRKAVRISFYGFYRCTALVNRILNDIAPD
jgi:hypothetical protein